MRCAVTCVTREAVSPLDQSSLTLGLLRGLEERPVDAPLTDRDLTNRTGVGRSSVEAYNICPTHMSLVYH